MKPRTLFEKIWDDHVVTQQPDSPAVMYIDRQYLHEVTSPQAFAGLRERNLPVHQPNLSFATVDHSIPTLFSVAADRLAFADDASKTQIHQLEQNCADYGIPCYGHESQDQGIVHVIGPEKGLTQPGMTIVCGDSHTSTHGAFGALAFGIGTSEILQVLATQCLLQRKPKSMLVKVTGSLPTGVSAKDIILALIAQIGIGGATGHVIEYAGDAIRALTMEERMTVCNMSIECGARAGMIAPDEVTYAYLKGREFAPSGAQWDQAVAAWRLLPSDDGARYDREIILEADSLQPMVTFGTNPGMGMPITGKIPNPDQYDNESQRSALQKALRYMGFEPDQPIAGQKLDVVFIGSCTNGRLSDLRVAAQILKGRKVAAGLTVLVVPGSREVLRQAEKEGLDRVFIESGAQWRDAGCSMCIAMNGDQIQPGQYALSTSNRNFEGRQGKGGRTLLASPATAAASAIFGCVTDPREIL